MNYTPQQLAQALTHPVSFFGPAGAALPPQVTQLDPMHMQSASLGSPPSNPAAMAQFAKGLMNNSFTGPPNPWANGLPAGTVDAGSMSLGSYA